VVTRGFYVVVTLPIRPGDGLSSLSRCSKTTGGAAVLGPVRFNVPTVSPDLSPGLTVLAPLRLSRDETHETASNRADRITYDRVLETGCQREQSGVSRDRQTDSVKEVTGLEVVQEKAYVICRDTG
jgi:hypothetical protein